MVWSFLCFFSFRLFEQNPLILRKLLGGKFWKTRKNRSAGRGLLRKGVWGRGFGLTPEHCGKRPPEQSELWEGKPSKPYLLRAFQPYSDCTKSFPKVLSAKRFQATKAMRAKRAVTVPPATVLWVPLRVVHFAHWKPREPQKPRDDVLKTAPFEYYKSQSFGKPQKPRDEDLYVGKPDQKVYVYHILRNY